MPLFDQIYQTGKSKSAFNYKQSSILMAAVAILYVPYISLNLHAASPNCTQRGGCISWWSCFPCLALFSAELLGNASLICQIFLMSDLEIVTLKFVNLVLVVVSKGNENAPRCFGVEKELFHWITITTTNCRQNFCQSEWKCCRTHHQQKSITIIKFVMNTYHWWYQYWIQAMTKKLLLHL